MLKLYGYDTINTLKILMLLFETGSDFEFIPINIRTGEQHSPDFRAVNPAGKVPVIWNDGRHQTESNAILLSLAKKASWGLVADPSLQADINNLAVLSGLSPRALFWANRILGKIGKNAQSSCIRPLRCNRQPVC